MAREGVDAASIAWLGSFFQLSACSGLPATTQIKESMLYKESTSPGPKSLHFILPSSLCPEDLRVQEERLLLGRLPTLSRQRRKGAQKGLIFQVPSQPHTVWSVSFRYQCRKAGQHELNDYPESQLGWMSSLIWVFSLKGHWGPATETFIPIDQESWQNKSIVFCNEFRNSDTHFVSQRPPWALWETKFPWRRGLWSEVGSQM